MSYNQDNIINKVKDLINNLGFDMLELKILRTGKNTTLRCVVDLIDGGVSIDNCVKLNKEIGRFLEEEDILPDNFTIEVNSPGIDRPLYSEKDFLKVKGRYVNLWFKEAIGGKDFIEGRITDIKDNITRVRCCFTDFKFQNIVFTKDFVLDEVYKSLDMIELEIVSNINDRVPIKDAIYLVCNS